MTLPFVGKLVIDRKVPCWNSDWRVDPYNDEYVEESFESHELYPDMLIWDCCGCLEGAPGCETQSGQGGILSLNCQTR